MEERSSLKRMVLMLDGQKKPMYFDRRIFPSCPLILCVL